MPHVGSAFGSWKGPACATRSSRRYARSANCVCAPLRHSPHECNGCTLWRSRHVSLASWGVTVRSPGACQGQSCKAARCVELARCTAGGWARGTLSAAAIPIFPATRQAAPFASCRRLRPRRSLSRLPAADLRPGWRRSSQASVAATSSCRLLGQTTIGSMFGPSCGLRVLRSFNCRNMPPAIAAQ